MSSFKISISESAKNDILKAIDYYDDKVVGLGKKFSNEVKSKIKTLKTIPFFQIRYDNIRCMPLNKFPFMIHFSVDNELRKVEIFGIINTSLDPDNNWVNQE